MAKTPAPGGKPKRPGEGGTAAPQAEHGAAQPTRRPGQAVRRGNMQPPAMAPRQSRNRRPGKMAQPPRRRNTGRTPPVWRRGRQQPPGGRKHRRRERHERTAQHGRDGGHWPDAAVPQQAGEALGLLQAEMFEAQPLADIFRCIQRMHAEGRAWDGAAVAGALGAAV